MKNELSITKKTIITAMLVALSAVLPIAFHAVPNAGKVFSPIHIPSLLAGLILPWNFSILVGIFGPILSMLLSGMPQGPMLLPMIIELSCYAIAGSIMMKLVRTKSLYADLYISLIVAMLFGRVIAGSTRALIFSRGSYAFAAFWSSYFVTCIPGIILQLVIIPSLVKILELSNLLPKRYNNKVKEEETALS